jgi:3-deoxy-D-manno-octulosonate 8-phosphate phosphatase (KDO 8-P phosphatase)
MKPLILNFDVSESLQRKAAGIKLLVTDCDGVLTDTGVYYGEDGEELKRFSIRDGMGVERLRKYAGVEVAIVTGEGSPSVVKRAEKLNITLLFLSIKDKPAVLRELCELRGILESELAFIGDDTNDVSAMERVGLACCPSDATMFAKGVSDYVCTTPGGQGALREVAELIIFSKFNHA